jgi:hypothetical protein
MTARITDLDLLWRVVGAVQREVSGLRGNVVAASDALGPLRADPRLTKDQSAWLQLATAELASALEHLGEIQGVLAAAAQSMVVRDGARRKLGDR